MNKGRQRRGIRLQNLGTVDLVMELLSDTVELESKIDPGLPMDTCLVCNGQFPTEHEEFFLQVDGTPTPGGRIRVMHRDNSGLSFGAYAYAFNLLRDRYEYWLLSEDDVVQTRSGYLPVYLEALSERDTGFVATVGIAAYHDYCHAHGGCGFTSREILDGVAERHGGLLPHARIEPVFRRSGSFDHAVFCSEGEIPLTNDICQMGYTLRLVGGYTEAYYGWKHGNGATPE